MTPVRATRYVTPLREGGSLPGLMEADDLGMYVVKFCGAGQGPRALVAEVICAEIAGALGLSVPRWVPVLVPEELAPAEPDEEVQHLLRLSVGMNLGIDFLPGALDVGPMPSVDPQLAGRIVWLDALITNADRSWRNPNMLLWHRALQLIDHGAALTFHHSWAPGRADQVQRFATRAYEVADHALLECAPDVAAADTEFADRDWAAVITDAVAAVPDEWLVADSAAWGDPDAVRAAYREFLSARIGARSSWVPALVEAVESGPVRDARGHRVSARQSSGPPEWIPELTIGREDS
ncbi:MAG TPA: HipA family kinase [Candidatus Limnocylindrales bacterium]|nr:HipA family kinase [Candidatus Limnocylindrales bacterium]